MDRIQDHGRIRRGLLEITPALALGFYKKDAKKTRFFRKPLEIVYTAEGAARDARDDVGILTHW